MPGTYSDPYNLELLPQISVRTYELCLVDSVGYVLVSLTPLVPIIFPVAENPEIVNYKSLFLVCYGSVLTPTFLIQEHFVYCK